MFMVGYGSGAPYNLNFPVFKERGHAELWVTHRIKISGSERRTYKIVPWDGKYRGYRGVRSASSDLDTADAATWVISDDGIATPLDETRNSYGEVSP